MLLQIQHLVPLAEADNMPRAQIEKHVQHSMNKKLAERINLDYPVSVSERPDFIEFYQGIHVIKKETMTDVFKRLKTLCDSLQMEDQKPVIDIYHLLNS